MGVSILSFHLADEIRVTHRLVEDPNAVMDSIESENWWRNDLSELQNDTAVAVFTSRSGIVEEVNTPPAVAIDSNLARTVDQICQTAITTDSYNDAAWRNHAWLLWKLGDHTEAVKALATALKLSPDDPFYIATHLVFAVEVGNQGEIRQDVTSLVSLQPAAVQGRIFHFANTQYPEAVEAGIKDARLELRKELWNPSAESRLARLEFLLGHDGDAYVLAMDVLQRTPSMSGPWRTLGKLAAQRGRMNEAIQDEMMASVLDGKLHHSSSATIWDGQIQTFNPAKVRFVGSSQTWSQHAQRILILNRRQPILKNDLLPRNFISDVIPPQ